LRITCRDATLSGTVTLMIRSSFATSKPNAGAFTVDGRLLVQPGTLGGRCGGVT
jgi:hypothetical protein